MNYGVIIHIALIVLFLLGFLVSVGIRGKQDPKNKRVFLLFYRLGLWFYRHIGKNQKMGYDLVVQNMRLLYPTEDVSDRVEHYYAEKTGYAFMALFVGNIVGLLLALFTMGQSEIQNGYLISRNSYGEGTKEVILEASVGDDKLPESIPFTVEERQYTSEEIVDLFDGISSKLEKEILGQNEQLSVVCYDLNLVTSLPDYPVDISWKLDDYEVMSSNGKLQTENLKPEGTPVLLTAEYQYHEFEGQHSFYVMVYPLPKSGIEKTIAQIQSKLEEYQKETIHNQEMVLPQSVEGERITYSTPPDMTNMVILLIVLISSVFIFLGKDKDLHREVQKREREMMLDYPEIVSKLTLFLGAGMTIRGAFEKIALEYEKRREVLGYRFAYEEMLIGVRQMQGGVPEGDVYTRFGERCHIQKYCKLGALLSQNLRKGMSGLLDMMEAEERDAFEDRKSLAKKLGEEAGTKLLLPMGMMLVVVMIIVILPAFLSFGL